jgi:hypothetical protein
MFAVISLYGLVMKVQRQRNAYIKIAVILVSIGMHLLTAGALIALWVLVVQRLLEYGNCTFLTSHPDSRLVAVTLCIV